MKRDKGKGRKEKEGVGQRLEKTQAKAAEEAAKGKRGACQLGTQAMESAARKNPSEKFVFVCFLPERITDKMGASCGQLWHV